MNDHARWSDEIASYALGTLDANAAREVERHLNECEQCRAELRQLRAVVDLLPLAAQPPGQRFSVPETVKAAVMRNVRTKSPAPWAPYAIAAACAAAAVILGLLYVSARYAVSRLSHDNRENTVAIQTLLSPNALHYAVAHGQVVVNGDRAYLVMQNLRALPSRRVYQAWTQKNGSRAMSPSLTFTSQGSLTLVQLPENAHSLVAIAVSIEPAGGSAQPTTKPIFVVKLQRPTAQRVVPIIALKQVKTQPSE